MIFTRRSLQRRLDELRATLGDAAVGGLAARLNRPGRDSLSAMWELVVLHGLARHGQVVSEQPLGSGRRPDVRFVNGNISFTADITTVSDEGLDEANPYQALSEEIEIAKKRLGLPIGGVDLRIHSRQEKIKGGMRTILRLPHKKRIPEFVRNEIVPRLREQMSKGASSYKISIDEEQIGVDITIDAAKGHYNSGSYGGYDVPASLTKNPLYNRLRDKADQLRGATGLVGIIVGDADSAVFRKLTGQRHEITAGHIAYELLRQNSSVHFVLLLTIKEAVGGWWQVRPPRRHVEPLLVVRPDEAHAVALEDLFRRIIAEMPTPKIMPVNAALRAREADYDLGHHGGYGMTGNKVRIGSREFTEILAGRRTIQDDGAKHVGVPRVAPRERNFAEGRLPSSINVIKTGENDDDDWIEIEFGDPDPAISPLC
jgi:hypothetical protein